MRYVVLIVICLVMGLFQQSSGVLSLKDALAFHKTEFSIKKEGLEQLVEILNDTQEGYIELIRITPYKLKNFKKPFDKADLETLYFLLNEIKKDPNKITSFNQPKTYPAKTLKSIATLEKNQILSNIFESIKSTSLQLQNYGFKAISSLQWKQIVIDFINEAMSLIRVMASTIS
jgi:hypothetical protein